MSNNDKEREKFEKKLNSILSSSTSAKAWSDLLPITREIYQLLSKTNNDINFSMLNNKLLLAKRLAQCLNPECPSGVHEVVLDIYYLILHNIVFFNETCLMDNLGIYACGLFPFYPNASLNNKKKFMDKIVNGCFLCFRQDEITLCLPGLLTSLIQGLDDNNDNTKEQIYTIFNDLIDKLSPNVFYGVYWTLILRNKLLRPSGMKYLYEKIEKYTDYEKMTQEKKDEIIFNEYPNINTVVINALCQVVEEKDIPTVRTGMDFITTRLPLTKENKMITDEAKITLIVSCLKLLIKNEYSTTRRLKNLILGMNNDDDINLESEDMVYKINLVVEAYLKIFDPDINYTQEQLKNNIKIISQFSEQQEEFTNLILPKISFNILLCVVHYWQTELNSSEKANTEEIIKKMTEFIEKEEIYLDWLWISIANNLKSLIDDEIEDSENEDYLSIKELKFINIINDALQPLKFGLLFLDIKPLKKRIKYYLPIITHLLNIMKKFIINNRSSLEKLRQILLNTLVIIKNIQEKIYETNTQNTNDKKPNSNYICTPTPMPLSSASSSTNNSLNSSISSISSNNEDKNENNNLDVGRVSIYREVEEEINKFNICEEVSLEKILDLDENNKVILKNLTESIINYQKFYINILGKYLEIKKESQITKNEMTIFRQSTEIMIRLQEYAQQGEVPKWIKFLQKIIFNKNGNMKLSLEAANYLLDMNMSSFNHHDIYNKIKDDFQNKEIDSDIIDQKSLDDLISKTGVQKNCHELLMGKLYLVLSNQSYQKNIMDLLIKIANMNQVKFLNIIKNSFNLKNIGSTQQSMKLYSDFWKLSNEYYNEMIFFKNGECIFNMLDCLDDENPLLRHLSKSWLNQAYQQFQKILDPIYNILLDDQISIVTNDKDKIIIDKEYNTIEIRKAFRRLKNIILNSSVMDFLKKTKAPQEILSKKNLGKLSTTEFTYLALLIGVTLRFTQGKCIESLCEDFKNENYSVNASSCEFLEFLLNYIKDKDLLLKFALQINQPIISLLDKAIEDNDEVMQVQLLSVLRVLYFNPSSVYLKNQNNKNNALTLFKNPNLHNCLIKGMTNEYFYVRDNFIKFTVQCLPHFNKVMNDTSGFRHFYQIGGLFITNLTEYIGGRIEIEKKGRKDTEKFSQFDTKNNNLVFKNYLDEYKENKRYDENDILMLLTGLRDILFTFMGNTELDEEKTNENAVKAFWVDFKKLLVGNKKTSSSISNFFNNMFGLENDSNESKDGEISAMPKNLFNGQIYNLMNCLLLTWINESDKYEDYDYCLNSNGILPLNENSKIGSLTKEDIKINMNNIINKNPIKKIVKNIGINLFKSNPIDFIETLLNIWCFNSEKNHHNSRNTNLSMDKQYKLSIIELLISLKIPLNIILFCMEKIAQKKINSINNNKRYMKSKESKCYITPYEFSLYEAKFFHFIYSYILLHPNLNIKGIYYNDNRMCSEKYESLKEMINLINIINSDTKIIYTTCWIYELLQLTLYKFPISNMGENSEIKKGLIDIFNNVTNKLADASFEGKTDSKYVNDKKLVLPFLPHVYYNIIDELYKTNNLYKKVATGQQQKKDKNEENMFELTGDIKDQNINNTRNNSEELDVLKGAKGKVNDFYKIYFSAAKVYSEYLDENIIVNHDAKLLNSIYRKLSLITLKSNFYKIIIGIYYDNPNSMRKQLMEILKGLIGLIKLHQQDTKDTLFYAEYSTDFLVSLMKDIPELLTKIGKDIYINYLNGPTFFITTPKMLRNWRKIISISVKHYPELLSDLIKTIGGGFLSLGSSDEDKIKTLRRISFIIYSCEKDTFSKEFEVIKSKVKDLLGSENKNSKLKDEIFLMMRVLFLRFSHEGVMKMIRDLWPIIFMELIQNIEDPKRNKDIDLIIESFKFIELLSLANVEEFSLYEWNFILDTYEMKNLDSRNEKSFLSILLDKNHKKVFKPITVKFLYNNKMFNNIDDELLRINKGKSELFICPKKNNVKELVKELLEGVKKFFYSIGDMNSYKVPVNYEQIEEIIENDFLEINNKS